MKGKRLKNEIKRCKAQVVKDCGGNPWIKYICDKGVNWNRVINGARKEK